MKRVVQAGGIAIVLLLIAVAAAPSHVELTVTTVGSDRAAISGWIDSERDGRVTLRGQRTPWERRVAGWEMAGGFETDGDGPVRVRAVLFKGTLRLSELELVGTRVSVTSGSGYFSGRTR